MTRIKIASLLSVILVICNMQAQKNPFPFKVEVIGQGKESIILIPGFASSGDVWSETVSSLNKKFSCHVLTMPGFAGVPAEKTPSFKLWQKYIEEYIKFNNISHPILIGHSMGGALALAIASNTPDLVSKIIVVDALPCLSAVFNPAFKSSDSLNCTGIVNQLTSMSDMQFTFMQKQSLKQLVADSVKAKTILEWSLKSDKITFAQMYCDFSNIDLRSSIDKIKCPALVLLETGFVNMNALIASQYSNVKNVKLMYSTKGLHFIMYDDPQWYLDQIVNFLIK